MTRMTEVLRALKVVARDEYDCHHWAAGQNGFDPTLPGGGVPADQAVRKRNDYFPADVACLEGRGYTVR